MNNTTATSPTISRGPHVATHCQHCGEELGISNIIESDGEYFCCNGCSSVYELLNNLGLGNFYRIKEEQNIERTGRPIDSEKAEEYEYLNQDNFINQYTSPQYPLRMNFYIEGIHCGACLWLIEKIPGCDPDIESVSLNLSTNVAIVDFKEKKKFSTFPEIVRKFGYKAHPIKIDEDALELQKTENRKSLIRISLAAVCAGNIMLLSAAIYSGADGVFGTNFGLLNLLLSLPVVTYCAVPFYKSVYTSLIAKRVTVDIPIVFVVLVGFFLSTYNYLNGNDQVYFDSVAAFIFLLLASRYFLKSVQERIFNKQRSSGSLFSQNRILIWDNQNKQFFLEPVEALKTGQKIKLKKGARIPVDGKLLSTDAELNLSVLTGENIPQTVLKNDTIYAGSVLESDEVVILVNSTGNSTRIGKILKEVQSNYQSKVSFSTSSDKFATFFTLLVGSVAILSFIIISGLINPSTALNRVMAFVLIACPCAFVFALPLSMGLSLRSAVEKGILIKNAGIFEKLPLIRNIFFDKTGTLTKGIYKILSWNIDTLSDNDLAAILAIEKESNHPIARSIVSHLSNRDLILPEVKDFRQIYTKGIEANVDNHIYRIVSDKNIRSSNDLNEIITTKIIIEKDGVNISEISLGDSLKEDAKLATDLLKSKDFNLFMLSGDNKNNVKQTALKVGIEKKNIYWEQTPEDKSQVLKNTELSMMIGDGLNDTAAFSSADVAVSVQGSAEESLKVSDAYILDNSLIKVVELFHHAGISKKSIRRNTSFSIAYNIIAGTLALLGYINPLAAAVLMPLSSLLLIGSTLYGQNNLNQRSQIYL